MYFDGEEARYLLYIDRRRELDAWPTDRLLRMLEEFGLWSPGSQQPDARLEAVKKSRATQEPKLD